MCTQAARAAALSAAIDRASTTRSATRGSATLYRVNRPWRRPSTYPQPARHARWEETRPWDRLAARPGLDGQILGQQAAVERGRRNFGPLLRGQS